MAPSTPPPPSREELAAFTIASVVSLVRSAGPSISTIFLALRRSRMRIDPRAFHGLRPYRSWRRSGATEAAPLQKLTLFLVGQRLYAGQLLAFQEFERRAATGGDMSDLVGDVGCFHGCDGITATNDRDGAAVVGNRVSDLEGAFGKSRDFEDAHGAIPDDGASIRDFF